MSSGSQHFNTNCKIRARIPLPIHIRARMPFMTASGIFLPHTQTIRESLVSA